MKKCSKCRIEKSFDRFHKNKSNKDGLQKQCKDCRNKNGEKQKPFKQEHKICSKCNKEKPFKEFWKSNSKKCNKDGHIPRCKNCSYTLKGKPIKQTKQNHKICSRCNEEKSFTLFSKDKNGVFGLHSWCKKCKNNQMKENYPNRATEYRAQLQCSKPTWYEDEKSQMFKFYKNRPKNYHIDHIIPINGKNISGLHCLENLQYLSKKQNCSKGNDFIPYQKFFKDGKFEKMIIKWEFK